MLTILQTLQTYQIEYNLKGYISHLYQDNTLTSAPGCGYKVISRGNEPVN